MPPAESGDPPSPATTSAQGTVWKKVYAFFLGPMLLGIVALGIFTMWSVATHEPENPDELVRELFDGSGQERWRAAFKVARLLQPNREQSDPDSTPESRELRERLIVGLRARTPELLAAFEGPNAADAETKRYLALIFGRIGETRATEALARALQSDDAELVHHSLAAIALILEQSETETDDVTLASLLTASRRPEPNVRATAVFALGVAGATATADRLREGLSDPAPQVRWQAAFALAQLGHDSGEGVLIEILDGGPILAGVDDPIRRKEIQANAIRAAGKVRSPALLERLKRFESQSQD